MGSNPTSSSETPLRRDGGAAESQERVKFAGRIGAQPQYARFENGTTRIRFPVGEHLADGSTDWHKVYATNKYADRIHAKALKKGDLVEVTGVVQERFERDQDGNEREATYIYAFGVKHR